MYRIDWEFWLNIKNPDKAKKEIHRIYALFTQPASEFSLRNKEDACIAEFSLHCQSTSRNDAVVETLNISSQIGAGWYIMPIQSSVDSFTFEGIKHSDFKIPSIKWIHFLLKEIP